MDNGDGLIELLIASLVGLLLLFAVIQMAVLSAIRQSRKPTRAERKRSAS